MRRYLGLMLNAFTAVPISRAKWQRLAPGFAIEALVVAVASIDFDAVVLSIADGSVDDFAVASLGVRADPV
jgi:hypothetical protein